MIILPYTMEETKAVGTSAENVHRDIVLHRASHKEGFADKHGSSYEKAWKALKILLDSTERRGKAFIESYREGKGSFDHFRGNMVALLRNAYDKAYELGLHATGATRHIARAGIERVTVDDRRWLNSAFQQEIQYLDKFLRDIRQGRINQVSAGDKAGPVSRTTLSGWHRRFNMYVTAVGSVFYSGRIMGVPPNFIVLWVSKLDAHTCPQCRYMATQAPFSKYNLPITPGSGYTRCLGNCRCKLVLRQVEPEYYNELMQKAVSRETHLRKLKAARV